MNPDELRQRKKIYAMDAQAILDGAEKDGGRDPTDEENAQVDALLAKSEALNADIAKAEACEKRAMAVTDAVTTANKPTPRKTQPMKPGENLLDSPDAAELPNDIRVGQERLFDDPYGGYGEECGFAGFALDVKESRHGASSQLCNWGNAINSAAGDGMNTFIGHDGGYLIPGAFGAMIDNIAIEASVIRPRATVIPMTTQMISFPALDDVTHASNTLFGGVQAYWVGEEGQLTATKPKFRNVELRLHKITAFAYVSGESLDWSPLALDAWLPTKLAQAIAWKEDDGLIGGVGGAGLPVGLLNSPCKITVSKETGQKDATIVFENIVNMDSRVWQPAGTESLIWIANRTIKKVLPLMNLAVGTGGVPVFMPANAAADRPLQTLYGFPIVFTEHAPALGSLGDITLANVREYYVGIAVGKTRTDRSIHLKFDFDQVAYRVVTYSGGVHSWRVPFQPQNGDTLSPVIKLEARP